MGEFFRVHARRVAFIVGEREEVLLRRAVPRGDAAFAGRRIFQITVVTYCFRPTTGDESRSGNKHAFFSPLLSPSGDFLCRRARRWVHAWRPANEKDFARCIHTLCKKGSECENKKKYAYGVFYHVRLAACHDLTLRYLLVSVSLGGKSISLRRYCENCEMHQRASNRGRARYAPCA